MGYIVDPGRDNELEGRWRRDGLDDGGMGED